MTWRDRKDSRRRTEGDTRHPEFRNRHDVAPWAAGWPARVGHWDATLQPSCLPHDAPVEAGQLGASSSAAHGIRQACRSFVSRAGASLALWAMAWETLRLHHPDICIEVERRGLVRDTPA